MTMIALPPTRADSANRTVIRDELNHRILEQETLPDGSVIWVASDTRPEFEGCIAQASEYEDAIVALDAAREHYADVLRELRQTRPLTPPSMPAVVETKTVSAAYILGVPSTTTTK